MQMLKLKGVKKALVEVRVSNMPAITFMRKQDFQLLIWEKTIIKIMVKNAYVMVRDFSNERD